MPNHVTHKLLFPAVDAEEIFAAVCPGGKFDFNLLIPQPLELYHGDTSADDEKDFPCNWYKWGIAHWGTKWNAYDASCGIVEGQAFIQFDCAWSVPYPVISAFANKFKVPFEHRYYDEGDNFWGIETWGTAKTSDAFCRIAFRKSEPADQIALAVELKNREVA